MHDPALKLLFLKLTKNTMRAEGISWLLGKIRSASKVWAHV